ncbi:carbohydrate ABC transporter membrane protein 1 (CUT1 family) [Hydrogenispora ethanolica]|uniref:Carbohydrate ABC transporter membrane protein 1 (CUT1 family) n=1 Tax=Hydrogenispora ethanolica TaxID=1082276 RepID=A0A4R1RVA1_HYDET|nr:sugar ABC transporter permease [Hydrogenispora ethanolica]TCL70040.1 carbohydrate ABC transporter membrane protein 1 (CUT1 family) [Hydrogenispora ethanolica]
MYKKDHLIGIAFLVPAIIFMAILIVYPLVNSFTLSFYRQLIYETQGVYVGFQNYLKILYDPGFWQAFKLSLIWTVTTIAGQVVIGVAAALILHADFKGRGLARAFVMLPFFMPTVAVTLMWKWLLNEQYGFVNYLLMSLHVIEKPISWLGTSSLAMASIVFIGIWRYFPFVTINVLSRLQTIQQELYEAASIDGANSWKKFWYITLPEIKGVLAVVILLRSLFMFNKVDIILLLTKGGPGTSTLTLPVQAYSYAFEGMQLGRGSANAIIQFLIVLAFILIYIRTTSQASKGRV